MRWRRCPSRCPGEPLRLGRQISLSAKNLFNHAVSSLRLVYAIALFLVRDGVNERSVIYPCALQKPRQVRGLGAVIKTWGRRLGEVRPQVLLPYTLSKTKGGWRELGEQAAKEQDRTKLIELTKEIIRLLDEKDARLKHLHAQKPQA
jgi:hypothetical protein